GKEYPSEHLFQDITEKIRTILNSPRDAFNEARVYKANQHPAELTYIIQMDTVIWHKFTQHKALKRELLGTGNVELVDDSPDDEFWGIGKNNQGKNELGLALETEGQVQGEK
ncbi:hypothetical protein C8R44DRAFT_599208, partial [Mycena epipterygia]